MVNEQADADGRRVVNRACGDCGGTGVGARGGPCELCHGTGRVDEEVLVKGCARVSQLELEDPLAGARALTWAMLLGVLSLPVWVWLLKVALG